MGSRLFIILILLGNVINCNTPQKGQIQEKNLNDDFSLEKCNCKLIMLKNEMEILDTLKRLIIANSKCEMPSYGVIKLDFTFDNNNNHNYLNTVSLNVCDSTSYIQDKTFFRDNFSVDTLCRKDSSICGMVKVRLEYQ